MKQVQMEAKRRTAMKKNAVGRLRREQKVIPGVMYGKGQTAVSVEFDPRQIVPGMANALIKLTLHGEGVAPQEETVMLKDVKRHPVTLKILHADFVRIAMDEELEVRIPVHIVGTAVGIKSGGILEVVHREIDIRCLPALIPESVTVDVSALDINDAISVSALPVQEGVTILVDKHETVVHVVPPRVEEEPVAAAAAPAEADKKEPEVIGEKEREERRASKDKEG